MANPLPAWWNDPDLIMDQTARTFAEEEHQYQFLDVTNQIPTVTDSFPAQYTYLPPPPQVTTQQQHHHTSSLS